MQVAQVLIFGDAGNTPHDKSCLTRKNMTGTICAMNKVVPITTSKVAEMFGVDSSAVRRWVAKGKLTPSIVTPGGHYRFLPADLEDFKASA